VQLHARESQSNPVLTLKHPQMLIGYTKTLCIHAEAEQNEGVTKQEGDNPVGAPCPIETIGHVPLLWGSQNALGSKNDASNAQAMAGRIEASIPVISGSARAQRPSPVTEYAVGWNRLLREAGREERRPAGETPHAADWCS